MKLFKIYCSTGCTCCSDNNHYRGYYKSKEDAEKRIEFFKKPDAENNPVASQYAHKGRYSISDEIEAEKVKLSDKKEIFILDNGRWITQNSIVELNIDGSLVEKVDDDRIYGM